VCFFIPAPLLQCTCLNGMHCKFASRPRLSYSATAMLSAFGDVAEQAECRQTALCPAMVESVSTCPREGLVGWEGLDSVIGGSRRKRDDRGRGRGGPGRGREGRGRHSGGRGPASGGRYDQEQGRPQDFDGGGPPGRYSPHPLIAFCTMSCHKHADPSGHLIWF